MSNLRNLLAEIVKIDGTNYLFAHYLDYREKIFSSVDDPSEKYAFLMLMETCDRNELSEFIKASQSDDEDLTEYYKKFKERSGLDTLSLEAVLEDILITTKNTEPITSDNKERPVCSLCNDSTARTFFRLSDGIVCSGCAPLEVKLDPAIYSVMDVRKIVHKEIIPNDPKRIGIIYPKPCDVCKRHDAVFSIADGKICYACMERCGKDQSLTVEAIRNIVTKKKPVALCDVCEEEEGTIRTDFGCIGSNCAKAYPKYCDSSVLAIRLALGYAEPIKAIIRERKPIQIPCDACGRDEGTLKIKDGIICKACAFKCEGYNNFTVRGIKNLIADNEKSTKLIVDKPWYFD